MSDRRLLRRQRTIDEVVATALEVMAETGAAGLSLGEVAKRMGMRPPSLYGYFDSKAALCDEIFARGWAELAQEMAPSYAAIVDGAELQVSVPRHLRAFVGWALEHRAQAELMFWRPIPGWEPGAESYAAAVGLLAQTHEVLRALQQAGRLRTDVPAEDIGRVLSVLTTGVISQQLSNEPGVPLARGGYARELDRLAGMFLREFGVGTGPDHEPARKPDARQDTRPDTRPDTRKVQR
ncbi:MAG TPA: TetR/AcrR family transcriptional regulator [Marmoricola sp.]|jgi:AcrR family transcriptional regulator|nr:TetR/AcrR family transcriptional regulator [Marmoricola sp.]